MGHWAGLDGCGKCIPLYCIYSSSLLGSFVFIVLHFAFCLYLQQTTNIHACGGIRTRSLPSDRPQTLALDLLATGIGGIRSLDRPARSESVYRLSYPCPQMLTGICSDWVSVYLQFL